MKILDLVGLVGGGVEHGPFSGRGKDLKKGGKEGGCWLLILQQRVRTQVKRPREAGEQAGVRWPRRDHTGFDPLKG